MIQLKNIGHCRGVCQSKWRQVRFKILRQINWSELRNNRYSCYTTSLTIDKYTQGILFHYDLRLTPLC